MRFSFPLYTQIISMFVVNIVLLGLIGSMLAGNHLGWETILYAPIRERLRVIGFVIHQQMRALPSNQWNNVLSEFGNYYGIKLYVFNSRGRKVAGEPIVLPSEITSQLVLPTSFPFPPNFPKNPAELSKMSWFPPFGNQARPHPPSGIFIHTTSPNRFWIGTFMPMPSMREPGTLLAVSTNLWQTRLVENYGNFFLVISGIFCFSFIIWWPFVYGITNALGKLTKATEQIAAGKLDNRIIMRRNDEIGRLAVAINRMSNRLNNYLSGQKRFLGDIAHELSSPVARLKVALAILDSTKTPEQTITMDDIQEDLEQMSHLINELLAYSKASLADRRIELTSLDLEPILKASIARTCPNDLVELITQPNLKCLGDRLLLDRAFGNILRNAVRYAADGGLIEIKAFCLGKETIVIFTDNGPGVPAEAIELLGQPFYRPEPSRSRNFGGVGLGLAIVKTCIGACNGTVTIRNNRPKGLQVEVHLTHVENEHVQLITEERGFLS